MRKITVEGIEINFNDLTEQKQMELYEKNKQKYKNDASNSIYSAIQKMVVRDEKKSSEFLNKMLRDELNRKNDQDVIDKIFENEVFEIEEETIKVLKTSDYWKNRQKAAELSKDSTLLNQMLRDEIEGKDDMDIKEAIYANQFFEIEEETIKILKASGNWKNRQKAAELLKDSTLLNQMLRDEIEGEDDTDIKKAIYANQFFEMEEETIKILKISDNWVDRQKAAEAFKDSKELLDMLIKEFEGDEPDKDVLNEIIENKAFVFDKEELLIYVQNNY